MIAGTLAFLAQPADGPLANYHDSGFRAVDVQDTLSYLDGLTVQRGRVAGRVSAQKERVLLDGHEIETETKTVDRKVASEWLADVEAGWVVSERTFSTDDEHTPDWPFNEFEMRTAREIEPVNFRVGEFVRNQLDKDRQVDVEMTGRKRGTSSTDILWGRGALEKDAKNAEVGAAWTVHWDGMHIRGVLYTSGYIAIWEPDDLLEEGFARFVHDEILPVAYVPEDDEETTEQASLDADGSEEFKDEVADHLEDEGLEVRS